MSKFVSLLAGTSAGALESSKRACLISRIMKAG